MLRRRCLLVKQNRIAKPQNQANPISSLGQGRKMDIVVAVQKSGFASALDHDNGDIIWSNVSACVTSTPLIRHEILRHRVCGTERPFLRDGCQYW
ncbi:hypothetical protein Vadar_014401 [Vaccinium darrowii]|uniref:Uncharacterized protein n=1 Tax=Vaccinium darrowii TaxID=229202 RepID=A0ACB7X9T5_9ERIC|nr:hypothetical protein Vadar_014401 [Vaccinium darrowii]